MDSMKLQGEKFGKLSVVAYHGKDASNHRMWFCECECGNVKIARGERLLLGKVQSCGCAVKESGFSRRIDKEFVDLYHRWGSMKRRCCGSGCNSYKDYSGRGITMCEEWKDYNKFRNWALSHGYSKKLTIERIDVNGNYCPENCTWIPAEMQPQNTRRNIRITINGITKIAAEWARIAGLEDFIIYERYKRGDSGERLLRRKQVQNRRKTKTIVAEELEWVI